ncbi:OmpH family outer membrane protein [Puniceibacterium sp. IMCC21224]|uniref:OmpH family outer membrane protein n=1 Tax=Puniceibacterium sp. IMCC21224 TaxID=1618204 RepID=UPI001E4C98E7|nr:OmpH family outer membrane protein [Puniceibacterium sp. IMCC21224]
MPAVAQEALSRGVVEGRVQSPILTIEPDRLFAESAFGKRIDRELAAERAVITAENDRIAAALVAEEQSLTDRRDRLEPTRFRELADAFDEKVQRLRGEQDERARSLGTKLEEARREFLSTAQPVIEAIMRETGAALIVERRLVFISADVIDVTDDAIARIDSAIGDGSDQTPDSQQPGTSPVQPAQP